MRLSIGSEIPLFASIQQQLEAVTSTKVSGGQRVIRHIEIDTGRHTDRRGRQTERERHTQTDREREREREETLADRARQGPRGMLRF